MNLIELSNKFPTELDCVRYFERYRWRDGRVCPFCKSDNIGERNKDFRFHCKDCQRSFSVTTATRLHDTRLSLKTWLFAFSIIKDAKKGLSARQLQRNLNISYPTAWTMYHRIRDLMSIENSEVELEDVVELDTKVVDVSNRKCQAEEKETPGRIPEVADCYTLPKDLPFWMTITYDYDALKQDYTGVDFNGVTYYVR